jgi:hypothetical protein
VLVIAGAVIVVSGVGLALTLRGGDEAPGNPAALPESPLARIVFDEGSAVLESQDAYSTTLVDENGVHQTALSPTVVNVKVGEEWVAASAALTDDGADGLEALQHPLALSLAPTADDPELVSVASDGYAVTFALKGAADAPLAHVPDLELPSTEVDHAVYADVFPGIDLEYDVSPSALKESVVLSEAPTSAEVAYTWLVTAPGLVVEGNEHGDLEFLDPDGAVVFSMPIPAMWDSSGVEGEREPADANIPFEVTQVSDDMYEVTLRPDVGWLGDPARIYPVYVDPTLQTGPSTLREYKQDGVVYASDARVGNVHTSSSCCNWRTVAGYSYPDLMSRQIIGASLESSLLGGTANCYDGNVYTAYSWSYGNAGIWTHLSSFANCTTGGADEDIYLQLAAWVRDGVTTPTLVFTGYEAPVYSYKILSTTLYVYHVDAPTVTGVTPTTPANGATGVAFPVMQATGTISAGSNQFFQYIFTSTDGGAAWTSPWTSSGPYRVPDGALTPGKHYTYNIKTKDDFPASPEPTFTFATHPEWNFTMDAAPNVPTDLTVDGQSLTAPVVSTEARPLVCATVSDHDGGDIYALFSIQQGGVTIVDGLAGAEVTLAAGVTGPSCATLPYALADDGVYTISVKSSDGYFASDALTGASSFSGPAGALREIPGTSDGQTEAVATS